jgi:transcriptional regulator with XRE-family HTH domain
MPAPDKQLSAEQSKQIADTIREEIARRRISRQSLAELAKLSLSTLEKVLGGRRPFTLATTVRLEQALGVSLRTAPAVPVAAAPVNGDIAPDGLGAYSRRAVAWIEGTYVTIRPSFGDKDAIFAYRTEISWDEVAFQGDAYRDYAWAVYVAEVSVDLTTFEAQVDDFVAVQDVGQVIHPVMAAGQIEGGVAQGIGFALYENVAWKDGRMLNHQMTNYIIPTAADVPPIRVFLVGSSDASGPKGLGELPMDGPAPAIVNAISTPCCATLPSTRLTAGSSLATPRGILGTPPPAPQTRAAARWPHWPPATGCPT